MRFAITALGSSGGRTVGQVVDDIVRYLEPRAPEQPTRIPAVPSGEGPSSYYADRGSEPGRWLGYGAFEAGLRGTVDARDFARILAGRDPRTGCRLITAQGSAGRRPTLGAGSETRRSADGALLYDLHDVAAALGVTHSEAGALIAAGQRIAVGALCGSAPTEPAASFLVPVIDADGSEWVTERELERCELARARGSRAEEVAATGDSDDLLGITEAARLSGLTARYIRGLCRRWEDHRDEIEIALAASRPLARAYVVAYRGIKGKWLIKRGDLAAFLDRRAAPAVRVGYDLTLTTEKSLGVLALLGDDALRSAVLGAIEAGNDAGMAYLELHAASARSKGQCVLVRGLTVASFRHLTSRALDPFPHHHNVVANASVDENGMRRALDARGLYWHAQAASALATAEMRHRLSNTLGVRWRPGRSGGWEIDGISDDVVREFSRRRNEIDEAVAELEEAIGRTTTVDELQSIVLATRPAKEAVDPRELVTGWWDRASRHGLSSDALRICTGHVKRNPPIDRDAIFGRLLSPEEGLCAHSSVFTRSDVLTTLVDLPLVDPDGRVQPILVSSRQLDRLADEFLVSDHVVQLDPRDIPATSQLAREELFTTTEILGVQRRILDLYEQRLHVGSAVVPSDLIDGVLTNTPTLSNEQRELIREFCTSGHAVQCAVGRAGAGKTTTMRAAAAAWTAVGLRVVGTAVKGEAARHLAEGADIPSETVAWYLARSASPEPLLDAMTVLVIDEASTLSDRDLHALLEMAERAGASVRLIGDPDQHGAVAAGGMFHHLCTLHADETPNLATSHRVTHPADREAARALREGRAPEALELLREADHLHVADNEIDLYVGMLHRWWQAREEGRDHPMVDRRHDTRRQLNRLARHLLRTHGELGDMEVRASGDRLFAVGDRVVARMAARHLHVAREPSRYVRNGANGTVVGVLRGDTPSRDVLRVEFNGIGLIDVPRAFFDEHVGSGGRRDVGIDHAYAVTSYAVQGATYAASTSRIDEGATRAETYVDITRGRESNHLFITRGIDPLDGEHLPKVPPPPLDETISDRLECSGPERAALDLDPKAGTADAGSSRSRERAALRAARLARHQPPHDVVDLLPHRPSVPSIARRWDQTVASIIAYRVRWQPAPGRGRHGWALGRSPVDQAARAQRDAVVAQVNLLTVSAVAEGLREHGWDELPAWAVRHLEERAAVGRCRVDPASTSALYRRIEAHRRRLGLAQDDGLDTADVAVALLGRLPRDPAGQAAYRLLSFEINRMTAPAPVIERGVA